MRNHTHLNIEKKIKFQIKQEEFRIKRGPIPTGRWHRHGHQGIAPTLADLFMGDFGRRFVYTQASQPLLWAQFIDDIFVIWTHGREKLHKFISDINDCLSEIKFTYEISGKEISFLDTVVQLKENKLQTTLYTKPTDSNNYLHYRSAHPPHCKKGIPYGQFLRIRHICSNLVDFRDHASRKAAHFIRRGYPKKLVLDSLWRAHETDRDTLLSKGAQERENHNILVTTFHPIFNDLSVIVRDNWDILARSARTRNLHKNRLVTPLRRPPILRNTFVRARLDFHPGKQTKHRAAVAGRRRNVCSTPDCTCTVQDSIQADE